MNIQVDNLILNGAEESAVFSNIDSQQKRQLQLKSKQPQLQYSHQLQQKQALIYLILIHALNLMTNGRGNIMINNNKTNNTKTLMSLNDSSLSPLIKGHKSMMTLKQQHKLKYLVIKLLRLARHFSHKKKQLMIQNNNNNNNKRMNSVKLAMLLSMLVQMKLERRPRPMI
jgi:hypothetical protein